MNYSKKENIICCPPTEAFRINARYLETDGFSTMNVFDSHVHEECEIYVNLGGSVSFMTENTLYPISPYSVIITRPFEYHHCIYNDKSVPHKHFWILFSSDGNEKLLDAFFARRKGEGNLIVIPEERRESFRSSCEALLDKKLSQAETYMHFFTLISILSCEKGGMHGDITPNDLKLAVGYITEHLSEQMSIKEISDAAHVSVNTLERHFLSSYGMSPHEYIKSKRLANAARLLKKGSSVTDCAYESGFSSSSHFVSEFKKHFGVTPLKYKKQ